MTVPTPPPPPGDSSGSPSADEKQWGMFAWLGALIVGLISCGLGFIAPLVIMMTKGKESPFVRANAVEALNVFITVAIANLGALVIWVFLAILSAVVTGFFGVLGLVVWLIALGAGIYGLVISIMGAIAANNGTEYRAPFAIRLVK